MKRQLRCIVLASAALAPPLVGATPAGAGPIACGTTITASTTLTADMTCQGDAIVIGAPGVVLDLGGHTLTGAGAGGLDEAAGIRVQGAGATVRNGRIQNFRYGVFLDAGSDRSLVETLSLLGVGDGAHVRSSSNRVQTNSIVRNNSVGVWISGNGNVVEGNSMQQNNAAVFMTGLDNQIVRNDIVGEDGDDRGILVFRGGRIVGNRVSHYQGVAGIELLGGGEVVGNHVFANVDGIRVQGRASVVGNVAFGNADDGIDIAPGASAFLQGNTAIQNGDLGIEVTGHTIGAGGNRAFANGNPLQCVGVVCSG